MKETKVKGRWWPVRSWSFFLPGRYEVSFYVLDEAGVPYPDMVWSEEQWRRRQAEGLVRERIPIEKGQVTWLIRNPFGSLDRALRLRVASLLLGYPVESFKDLSLDEFAFIRHKYNRRRV